MIRSMIMKHIMPKRYDYLTELMNEDRRLFDFSLLPPSYFSSSLSSCSFSSSSSGYCSSCTSFLFFGRFLPLVFLFPFHLFTFSFSYFFYFFLILFSFFSFTFSSCFSSTSIYSYFLSSLLPLGTGSSSPS